MKGSRKATIGINPMPEILNPKCSCTKCDSATCFARRRTEEPCACEACTNSKSCLFYNPNIKLTDSKSGSIDFKDIEKELAAENIARELLKKEIIYGLDKNKHLKIISKKLSTVSYRTIDTNDKIEESRCDKYRTRVHSEAAANTEVTKESSYKEVNPSTAKLSAQVMDVPYKDFQSSLSKPHFSPNLPNISPYDIFNRIKEAYKACSCKVCECIVGKSLQNDLCKCKPCECSDCVNFDKQVKSFTNYERLVPKDDEGCPCIRCERGSCKGIGKGKSKEAQQCDCVGLLKCNYLKSNSSSRPCDCEPCQCIECGPRFTHRHRSMVVAPVGEDFSGRNACQCSPCECFECGHGFRLSTNQQNEMSTSVNRHPHCHCDTCLNEACIPDGTQSCRCERQSKVMSKPFQQDSHDYDIRRTTVTYDEAQKRKDVNYDTIAMFAAISNTYPKPEENAKQCDCDQCECLICKSKEHSENTNYAYPSKLYEQSQKYKLSNNDCKWSPCECQFCMAHNSEPHVKKASVYGCDVFDCIVCDGSANSNIVQDNTVTKKPKGKFSATGNCRCNPCECADCEKLMSSCIGDICLCSNCRCVNCVEETYSEEGIYPVKRGERLTPSIFNSKINDAFIKSCINTLDTNEEILKQPIAIKSSLKKPSAFSSYERTKTQDDCGIVASSQRCFQECYSNHLMASHNFNTRTEIVKHAQISKCTNDTKLHNKNIEPTLESNLSVYSSTSYLRDSDSVTPSKHRLKSWESSCNSSGYDYSNYLMHFPKTTVETCLNDIMQLGSENKTNTNLTPTDLSSKNNVRKLQNIDLDINVWKPPKTFTPTRTVFSKENPIEKNNQSYPKEDFWYSTQNFEVDSYKRQNKSKDVSKPVEKSILKEFRAFEKHSSTNTINNLNSLIIDNDYERVQNTLQEARAFSLHLVQLLEQYEKANREFKSISEKIKKPNESFTNKANISKYCNTKEVYKNTVDQIPTKEQQESSSGSSTEELVIINKNSTQIDKFHYSNDRVSEDKSHKFQSIIMNETCNETNEGRNESGDDENYKTIEVLNTITEEREPIDALHKQDKKRRAVAKLHRSYSKMYRRSIICSKRVKNTNSSSFEIDATVAANTNDTLEINKPIEQRLNLFDESNNDDKHIKKHFSKENLPKPKSLLKPVKKSTTELRVSVTEKYSKDQHVFQKDVVMIKEPSVEHSRQIVEMVKEPWPILKKNFYLGANAYAPVQRLPILTPLEKDVKVAGKTISKQPSNETATYLYENKALTKLHFEVKKLLDLPTLQTLESQKDRIMFNNLSRTSSSQTRQETEDCHRVQKSYIKASSSRNSCDTMKVNFLNVRRVSDHTVLVKWNTPRVLSNVEGYELLVDGRAVQKILGSSRCMAVVTCLPHNDNILFTVRTILSTPCPDHCPAVTVIYQPKIK